MTTTVDDTEGVAEEATPWPPAETVEEAWEFHRERWQHCLRCPLAEIRLQDDAARPPTCVYVGSERPRAHRPLFVLYPCPDPDQSRAARLDGGQYDSGFPQSPAHGLLTWAWTTLGSMLPWGMSEVAFGFALGCRPVDYQDPKRIMAPRPEALRACRPRWQTEIVAADPDLILLCGRHSLAAVRPDIASQYNLLLGDVVPFYIDTPSGRLTYEGLVTMSPEDVVAVSRPDHYELDGWDVAPERSHVDNPMRYWLWHLVWAAWLSESIRSLDNGKGLPSTWLSLCRNLDTFYTQSTTVRSLIERARDIAKLELEGRGVREFMTTTDIDPADDSAETGEEEDDGDEED